MAFQINPNIPLQAMANPINIGDAFAKAQSYQANALKLQALRDEYNAAKEERDRQRAMRQGMASELQKIQQGTPAQYRTTFPQTMPTGQMPQGMTGVLASERGQKLPQPALFGENILQGNFDINREMVSPAVAGRTPDLKDYLEIRMKQAFAHGDEKGLFETAKLLKDFENNPAKYFGGLTKAIDPVTKKPVLLAMTETGAVPSGYEPIVEEKESKPVPVLENGVPKTVRVPNTNEVKILMTDGTLSSGGSIQSAPTTEKPITKYQKIQLEGGLRDDYRKDSANFVEISRQGKIIESSLNDPSAAATLASATAFMKMLDPGSVVRESELAMAMKTTGMLDRLTNYFNVIQSGQVLTDNQKTDFSRLIKSYTQAANEAQTNLNKKYTQIAKDYDLDHKRVVIYDVEDTKKSDYMEYKKERDKAYKKGNYDLVRKLDEEARLDKLIK